MRGQIAGSNFDVNKTCTVSVGSFEVDSLLVA